MIEFICNSCSGAMIKNPNYLDENSKYKGWGFFCPSCKKYQNEANSKRRAVKLNKVETTTKIWSVPEDAVFHSFQTSPDYVMSCLIPARVRKATFHSKITRSTFSFDYVQHPIMIVWDLLQDGRKTGFKLLAAKINEKSQKIMGKKYLLSNTEMDHGNICWGGSGDSPIPKDLTQAVDAFFEQPFNMDLFPGSTYRVSGGYRWEILPGVKIPETIKGEFIKLGTLDVHNICGLSREECPCSRQAEKKPQIPADITPAVYRFRNYDPYRDGDPEDSVLPGNKWKDVTTLIRGDSCYQTYRRSTVAFASIDEELIKQVPQELLSKSVDGGKIFVAYGIRQSNGMYILMNDWFMFVWDGKAVTPMRRKKSRARLEAMGIKDPKLPDAEEIFNTKELMYAP